MSNRHRRPNIWDWWVGNIILRRTIALVLGFLLAMGRLVLAFLWGRQAYLHPNENILPMILFLTLLFSSQLFGEIYDFLVGLCGWAKNDKGKYVDTLDTFITVYNYH